MVSKFAEALDEAKPLLLVGGTSVDDCLASFRKGGASIVVGTPGRVEDMLNNYNVFDVRGAFLHGCGMIRLEYQTFLSAHALFVSVFDARGAFVDRSGVVRREDQTTSLQLALLLSTLCVDERIKWSKSRLFSREFVYAAP